MKSGEIKITTTPKIPFGYNKFIIAPKILLHYFIFTIKNIHILTVLQASLLQVGYCKIQMTIQDDC